MSRENGLGFLGAKLFGKQLPGGIIIQYFSNFMGLDDYILIQSM